MLRRAPTVLSITAEDVAAYEDRQEHAARLATTLGGGVRMTPQQHQHQHQHQLHQQQHHHSSGGSRHQQQHVPRHQVLQQQGHPTAGRFASLPPSSSLSSSSVDDEIEDEDGDRGQGEEEEIRNIRQLDRHAAPGVSRMGVAEAMEQLSDDEDMGDADDGSLLQDQLLLQQQQQVQNNNHRRRPPHQSHRELQRIQFQLMQNQDQLAQERRDPVSEAANFQNGGFASNAAVTPTPAPQVSRAAAAAAAAAGDERRAAATSSAAPGAPRATRSREERLGISSSRRR